MSAQLLGPSCEASWSSLRAGAGEGGCHRGEFMRAVGRDCGLNGRLARCCSPTCGVRVTVVACALTAEFQLVRGADHNLGATAFRVRAVARCDGRERGVIDKRTSRGCPLQRDAHSGPGN